jgi:hypothetical protein
MKPETERILRNLGLLGRLEANEKLLTQGQFFELHSPGWRQPIARAWFRENRQHNMSCITECIRLAKTEITNILSEHTEGGELAQRRATTVSSEVMVQEAMHTCSRIAKALLGSVKGLKNLKLTYADDAALLVQIDNICVDIDNFVNSIATSVGLPSVVL